MSKKDICELAALDETAERAGGYVVSPFENTICYDYRKILAYCKEKGIDPLDMTIREMNQFAVTLS